MGGGGSLTNGTTTKFVRSAALSPPPAWRATTASISDCASTSNGTTCRCATPRSHWRRRRARQVRSTPSRFDPIINIPVNKMWGGYFVFGPGYYHRSGKLDSSSVVPGSACNEFWNWWGTCFNGSVPINRAISFRQRKRIWSELRRRHHAQDHLQVRALRRVPLSARHSTTGAPPTCGRLRLGCGGEGANLPLNPRQFQISEWPIQVCRIFNLKSSI